ncbi:MAG: T9SS type A sorting domain-containing protein, partial [Gemmatimonadota bacterium]
TSEQDVAGVLLRFRYDGDVLEAGAPEVTERSAGMDVVSQVLGEELVVFVSSLSGEVIEAGSGPVVRVLFEVMDRVEDGIEVEVVEPVVFTADERISFGHGSMFVIKAGAIIPKEYSLAQNYPNPFNPVTSIEFGLPEDARVNVTVYNILGQVVTELVNDDLKAGYHRVRWDGEQAASGIYFYRIRANDFTQTRRMVLMK